jgi:hypothetical protein
VVLIKKETMMTKRGIAILVASVFLGAQAGIAADEAGMSTDPANDQYSAPEQSSAGSIEPQAASDASMESSDQPSLTLGDGSRIPITGEWQEPQGRWRSASSSDGVPVFGDDLVGQRPLPSQARYFEERAASLRAVQLNGDSFPPGDDLVGQRPLPSQAAYFEQRAANLQAAQLNGDSFPPSDDLVGQRPLPSQDRYFARKEETTRTAHCGDSDNQPMYC